jgi:hypothetical protein
VILTCLGVGGDAKADDARELLRARRPARWVLASGRAVVAGAIERNSVGGRRLGALANEMITLTALRVLSC